MAARSHGVALRYRRRERTASFRTHRPTHTTLELSARNPVRWGDVLILVVLGGVATRMAVDAAVDFGRGGGLALAGAMGLMGAIAWGSLAQLALERTKLSLGDNALVVRSGIVGMRRKRTILRTEIAGIETRFDFGWRVLARLRDGDEVQLMQLTYPDQAEHIAAALRRALRR